MMIVTCKKCNKNFDVDPNLIPENGRLLQCSSCNYKWFFKKEITNKPDPIVKNNDSAEKQEPNIKEIAPYKEEIVLAKTERPKTIQLLDKVTEEVPIIEKISIKDKLKNNESKEEEREPQIKTSKNRKNYNILGLVIVFIISFISLIIILDTFQEPISNIVPNIEFLLYSLYETVHDIVLFFSDLI